MHFDLPFSLMVFRHATDVRTAMARSTDRTSSINNLADCPDNKRHQPTSSRFPASDTSMTSKPCEVDAKRGGLGPATERPPRTSRSPHRGRALDGQSRYREGANQTAVGTVAERLCPHVTQQALVGPGAVRALRDEGGHALPGRAVHAARRRLMQVLGREACNVLFHPLTDKVD